MAVADRRYRRQVARARTFEPETVNPTKKRTYVGTHASDQAPAHIMPTLSQPERFNTDAQGGSDHRILTMRLPNGCPNGCPNAPPTPPGGGGVGSHMEGGNRHYQNPEKRHNIEIAHVQPHNNNFLVVKLHMCNLTTKKK